MLSCFFWFFLMMTNHEQKSTEHASTSKSQRNTSVILFWILADPKKTRHPSVFSMRSSFLGEGVIWLSQIWRFLFLIRGYSKMGKMTRDRRQGWFDPVPPSSLPPPASPKSKTSDLRPHYPTNRKLFIYKFYNHSISFLEDITMCNWYA